MAAGRTYTPIATTTVGTSTATVTITSIPSTYTDLVLVSNWRATPGSGNISLSMRFNSDSATNYSFTNLLGNGTAQQTNKSNNASLIILNYATPATSTYGLFVTQIPNYANMTTFKTCLTRDSMNRGGANPAGGVGGTVGLWRSTSAISSITMLTDDLGTGIMSGSSFTLYGILAA